MVKKSTYRPRGREKPTLNDRQTETYAEKEIETEIETGIIVYLIQRYRYTNEKERWVK